MTDAMAYFVEGRGDSDSCSHVRGTDAVLAWTGAQGDKNRDVTHGGRG